MNSKFLALSSLIAFSSVSYPAHANEQIGAGILKGIACIIDPNSCGVNSPKSNSSISPDVDTDPSPDVYTDPIREAKEKVSFNDGIMYVENPGPARLNQCEEAGYRCEKTIDGNLMLDTRETSMKKTNLLTFPITNFYSWVIDRDTVRFTGGNNVKFTSYVRSKSDNTNDATVFKYSIQRKSSGKPKGALLTGWKKKVFYNVIVGDESFGKAESFPVTFSFRCNSPVTLPNGVKLTSICKDLKS